MSNVYSGISKGDGTFNYTLVPASSGYTSVHLADYSGDGKADLTLYNSKTAAAYFGLGIGDGTFTFSLLFWNAGYDNVVPEDVNGDGKTDVILYDSASGVQYTGLSNGDGTFNYVYSLFGKANKLARF